MPESDQKLLETLSLALERIKTIQMLILSWEDRLRACEAHTGSIGADSSPFSTSASYRGDEAQTSGHAGKSDYVLVSEKCSMKSCTDSAIAGAKFCRRHLSRACHFEGCCKTRLGPEFCIRHGGGKRCEVPGCTKGASGTVGGGARFCISHGGGRRCRVEGCKSTAKRDGLCSSHGGRYECLYPNCTRTGHGPARLCNIHTQHIG